MLTGNASVKPFLSLITSFVLLILAAPVMMTQATADGLPVQLVYATFDPVRDGEPAIPTHLRAAPDTPYALLQFHGPVQPTLVAELEAEGVVFYGYVPRYTYVVRLDGNREALATHPAVRWLGPLHPAYKISPSLHDGALLIQLYPGVDVQTVAGRISEWGAAVLEENETAGLIIVSAEAGLVPALAGIEEVLWIQNDAAMTEFNDDTRWLTQDGVLDEMPLYRSGLTGAGQVGGVADSGLAVYDHTGGEDPLYNGTPSCYFADDGNGGQGGAAQLPSASHRKVAGYVVPPGAQGDFIDSSGHGTHVVGSLAGDRAPWLEPSAADGQAYAARVFFQDIGVGLGFPQSPIGTVNPPSDYRILFGQAYDPNGDGIYQPQSEPRTHSNSWGSGEPIYSVESQQTDAFMWAHPDFLIFFAAGNQGPTPGTVGYPATAKNVVTVGAGENGLAEPENMAYFSSHGPSPLPLARLKPTITAPGDRIRSASRGTACGTEDKSGTSMATPTLHGQALLMRQYLVDGYYPSGVANASENIHPSAALLKAMIINSGRPMGGAFTDNSAGGSWPSNGQGWGRATTDDVLYLQGDHRALWLHDEYALDGTVGFEEPGQSRTFTLTVSDGQPFNAEPFKVTLVWTDFPGSPLAGALVNDLHLTVTDPTGAIHYGNDVNSNDFHGVPELPPIVPDTVNPWEVVYLEHPVAGEYTITVTAAGLGSLALDPLRKQGFALVATGDLQGRQARAEIEFDTYDVSSQEYARLRVTDLDQNRDQLAINTVNAVLSSTTDLDGVSVTLFETAPDSGIFANSVLLMARGATTTMELAVTAGDEVRLLYQDADNGFGTAATASDTAQIRPLPRNFNNPPHLTTPENSDGDAYFRLDWAEPEERDGLIGYVVQATTSYTTFLWDDAEGAPADQWTTNNGISSWRQDLLYRQSGLHAYWSGRGDTGVAVESILQLRNAITLPPSPGAELSFYTRYFNDFNDNGYVEISTDGQNWNTLRRLYADPRVPPLDTRLQYHTLDLQEYGGQPVLIRFRYDNGVLSFAGESPGWWIDDISMSAGNWQTAALVPDGATHFEVQANSTGRLYYRVRAIYEDGSASGWSNVVEAEVQNLSSYKASGAGWLQSIDGDAIDFAFRVEAGGGTNSGKLQLQDAAAAVRIDATAVRFVGPLQEPCGPIQSGPGALEFHAMGTYNDQNGAVFRICVRDNGRPGVGKDTFYLSCESGCVYATGERAVDAVLNGGNVKVTGAATASGNASAGDASETPEVLLLWPLWNVPSPAGAPVPLTVQALAADHQPLPGIPVTLTQLDVGGEAVTMNAITDAEGMAIFPILAAVEPVKYIVTLNNLSSNGAIVMPALP